MKQMLFILFSIIIGFTMLSCFEKDVIIKVRDINKTNNIIVKVYKAETNEFLLQGRTDQWGAFKGTVQIKRNEKIKIICEKEDYKISTNTFIKKPSGPPLAVNVIITAEIVSRDIKFEVMNSIPNVEVYGVNGSGEKHLLGRTDKYGIVRATIKKRDYKKISFRYSLDYANVFSDHDLFHYYSFDSIPQKINLKAIPSQDLEFYFFCQEEFAGSNLSGVNVYVDNITYLGTTNSYGNLDINIHPTKKVGPFIGDVIKWSGRKENYCTLDTIETTIKPGKITYPSLGLVDPYKLKYRRQYEMSIQVLEDDYPVSGVDVIVNGKSYMKTDDTGKVIYRYYNYDINKNVKFEVKKEGLSAKPNIVMLGKIERSLTFNVETIHVFIKLFDSVTEKPITGLSIKRNGEEIGELGGMGRVKCVFPETKKYVVEISDPNKEYLRKTYSIIVSQNSIGNEYSIMIDPQTGVGFTFVDKKSRNAIEGVHIFRNGKEVGKTDEQGLYTENFDPAPEYYVYLFKVDNYVNVKEKKIYRHPGRLKETIELIKLSASIILKDDKGNVAPQVDIFFSDEQVGQTNDEGEYHFSPKNIGDTYAIKFLSPDNSYITTQSTFYLNKNEQQETFSILRWSWIEFHLVDSEGSPVPGVRIYRDDKEVSLTDTSGVYNKDFEPDPQGYFDFSFKKDYYMNEERKKVYRNPGKYIEEIQLKKLKTTVILKDDLGDIAPYVDVYISGEKVGQTDAVGEYHIFPKKIGDSYSMEFISEEELYVSKSYKFKFQRNEQQERVTIRRQSWIELHLIEPGGFTVSGVQVISSTGQTGVTDSDGIFRYKVVDKFNNVDFSFSKSKYENISKSIFPGDLITIDEIPIPPLHAFFYVIDSRTNKIVKDLQISVNGKIAGTTDANGKANIYPDEKPSDLEIYIEAVDNSYIPIKESRRYVENNLGEFMIAPRPIDINVLARWSSGMPVTGNIEIDFPYQKYELKRNDRGRHIFKLYSKSRDPILTITAVNHPNGGAPLKKIETIRVSKAEGFSLLMPITISLKPWLDVSVDPGVKITIIHDTVTGGTSIFEDEHDGDFSGELPDFGDYTIVRTGAGFKQADSTFLSIDKSKTRLNLKRQLKCQKVQTLYDEGNWKMFVKKVEQLNVNDECYCEMNKNAGEVSMESLRDYKGALEFYTNLVYKSSCVIDKVNPGIDPYIHLRMLECCVKSKQYNDGMREADKFDELVQLLAQNNKARSICNKNYLLGLLMIDEYWRLCDEKHKASFSKAKEIKTDLDKLGREIKNHLEDYESKRESCPSLQVQQNLILEGCK